MIYTSGPAILIAIALFFFIGLGYGGGQSDPVRIKAVLDLIVTQFNVWYSFIPCTTNCVDNGCQENSHIPCYDNRGSSWGYCSPDISAAIVK